MNMKPSINVMPIRLMVAALLAAGTLMAARGATALNGQLVLTPVTAYEETTYGIASGTELSGGLTTVGVGTAVYLEADINNAIPASDITSVTWYVTNFVPSLYSLAPPPTGWAPTPANLNAMLTTSPFGTNVPVYEPSSRSSLQVAGRELLRLPYDGQYTITTTIATTQGTTNISQVITAGVYLGEQICAECHDQGNSSVPPDMWLAPFWSQTLHAQVFSNEIDADGPAIAGESFAGESYISQSCFQCHTTGYDSKTNALVDGGFYDMEQKYGWTIPAHLAVGNYANMLTNYPYVAGMANVQCESCHGPGSIHVLDTFGNTNSSFWPGVDINENSGDCQQCHDYAPRHPYGTEWLNSEHATPPSITSASCAGCHSAYGFIARIDSITNGVSSITNLNSITNSVSFAPINCQACHEPHGNTIPTNNPHLIRALASVMLQDGATVVTNAGEGLLCMECHQERESWTNAPSYLSTKGSTTMMAPQADMLEGINGYTYGQPIPSGDHASISNTCVACHMQILSTSDPALLSAGGHTFNMSSTNGEEMVVACQQCHGPITSFNFPVEDFDGDGVTNGVQTQVQTLLNELAELLPGGTNNVGSTFIKASSGWTTNDCEAAYNYDFVESDGSLGVHNTAYAVGLLQASIANLTAGLGTFAESPAYWLWAEEYFGGVTTSAAAAPDAVNNTNNIPNWMMFALGLSPTQSGIALGTNGVVWIDDQSLGNEGPTNTIHIYTAAEISFNTVTNDTYQIQAITQFSGGWNNIGNPIVGTGSPVSYLTSMRNNPQMFFRVLTNP